VLAPLRLWCRDETGQARRREFERAFCRLNAGNFHWQLLDDLADEAADTEHGLITAPGFILLSQGAIAGRCRAAMDVAERFGPAGSALIDDIRRSQLLCDRFRFSSLCDRHRHALADPEDTGAPAPDSIEDTVRCALANCEDDLAFPLSELCARREEQSQSYLAAMRDHDGAAARRSLRDSKAGLRILLAAQEETAREFARDELRLLRDGALLKVLRIVELLTMHCYGKARRAVLPALSPKA
jgi:hypothetical protein